MIIICLEICQLWWSSDTSNCGITLSLMIITYYHNVFIEQATGGKMGHGYVLQLLFSEKSQKCK